MEKELRKLREQATHAMAYTIVETSSGQILRAPNGETTALSGGCSWTVAWSEELQQAVCHNGAVSHLCSEFFPAPVAPALPPLHRPGVPIVQSVAASAARLSWAASQAAPAVAPPAAAPPAAVCPAAAHLAAPAAPTAPAPGATGASAAAGVKGRRQKGKQAVTKQPAPEPLPASVLQEATKLESAQLVWQEGRPVLVAGKRARVLHREASGGPADPVIIFDKEHKLQYVSDARGQAAPFWVYSALNAHKMEETAVKIKAAQQAKKQRAKMQAASSAAESAAKAAVAAAVAEAVAKAKSDEAALAAKACAEADVEHKHEEEGAEGGGEEHSEEEGEEEEQTEEPEEEDEEEAEEEEDGEEEGDSEADEEEDAKEEEPKKEEVRKRPSTSDLVSGSKRLVVAGAGGPMRVAETTQQQTQQAEEANAVHEAEEKDDGAPQAPAGQGTALAVAIEEPNT